jgi:hypothetical protein
MLSVSLVQPIPRLLKIGKEVFVVRSVRHHFDSFTADPMQHFPVATLVNQIALLIVHELRQFSVACDLSHTNPPWRIL